MSQVENDDQKKDKSSTTPIERAPTPNPNPSNFSQRQTPELEYGQEKNLTSTINNEGSSWRRGNLTDSHQVEFLQ